MTMVKVILAFLTLEACMTFGIGVVLYALKTSEPPLEQPINPQVWLAPFLGLTAPYLFFEFVEDLMGKAWVAEHDVVLWCLFMAILVLVGIPLARRWAKCSYDEVLEERAKWQEQKTTGVLDQTKR